MQTTIFGLTFQLRVREEYFYIENTLSPFILFPYRTILLSQPPRDFRVRSALVGSNVMQDRYNEFLIENKMEDRYVLLPYSAIFALSRGDGVFQQTKFLVRRSEYFGIIGKEITNRGFIGHDKRFLLREHDYKGLLKPKGNAVFASVSTVTDASTLNIDDKHRVTGASLLKSIGRIEANGKLAKVGVATYRRIISDDYTPRQSFLHEKTGTKASFFAGISIHVAYRQLDIEAMIFGGFVNLIHKNQSLNLNGITTKYGIMQININLRHSFSFSWDMGKISADN